MMPEALLQLLFGNGLWNHNKTEICLLSLRCDHQEVFITRGRQGGITFLIIYYSMHFLPRTSIFDLRPNQSPHYLQQLYALGMQATGTHI